MRSIFNRRFGIILYWYIIITTICIHHTNQQQDTKIIQNVTEQKIQKLDDTNQHNNNDNNNHHKNDENLNPVNNSITFSSVCNNCTITVISSTERTKQTTSSSTSIQTESSTASSLSHQTILQRDKNELLSSTSERILQQNSNYQKRIQQSFHSSYLLLDKQKLQSENNEKIVNQVNDDVNVYNDDVDDAAADDDDDDDDGASFKLDQKISENNRKILSTTTPSQLPSPPAVSFITTTTTATTSTSSGVTSLLQSSSSSSSSLSEVVEEKPQAATTTELNSESKLNKDDKFKSLSSTSPSPLQIQNNVNDDVNQKTVSDDHNTTGIRHKNPNSNILTLTKEHTNSKNNLFYSIFHKFSLANIFGINNDNVDDNNDKINNNNSNNNNNNDSNSSSNSYHYNQMTNNDIISDIDNNNKLLYRYDYNDDNESMNNNYRRTKRTKRDSSIDSNKNANYDSSASSNSSSSGSRGSSISTVSVANKNKHKKQQNITSYISNDNQNSKSDNGYKKSTPSTLSSSSSSVSESSKLISSNDNRNEKYHQPNQLTTHSTLLNQNLNIDDDGDQINQTLYHHINENLMNSNEPMIIINEGGEEEFDSGLSSTNLLNTKRILHSNIINKKINDLTTNSDSEEYMHGDDPRFLPSGPIIRGPYYDNEHHPQKQQQYNSDDINDSSTGDDDEISVVYAEQHSEIRLTCEVNTDIATSVWFKNGQIVHTLDRNSRSVPDYRFIKEPFGGLTINNVMLEDDGEWQCEAENSRGLVKNARPIKLVVLDRPKPPYLLIDSRRLDAGNIFVPVKENSELSLACISEGGNPKPTLTWEVLLSPGVDRHAQKVAAEVLELEEIKNEKDKEPYKINSGAKSEARLPAVYRAHHNARILCVMEHPTLKIRQNASLLLDVQYTPSFAISRTPGFGYPLREGIEVSLKCDVDSNPPSTPRWQKDDGDTPVPQTGDGFLNFTSIRREHSGWYKCTSRHLNFQYSSIGYYLSVRYDSVDVTSEPDDQEVSVAASHNPNKGQLEVQLGGAVTLQCPQGSLGCWSHLDPVTARLRGLGVGLSTPTGQFSLKDVVYQDAGTYKCIGQSPNNKKKLEVLQTVGVLVKGPPTVSARNSTPVAYPGSPLHLTVEFCANPPAYAARWLHGDRVYTPGNQYGSTVLAYAVSDLPTPFCKEARLTYVSMHERVPRTFYFIVSSPGGVAEAIFKVNFTLRYRTMSNSIDDEEEELSEPEEIHFPVFGNSMSIHSSTNHYYLYNYYYRILLISLITVLFSKLIIIQ